MTMTNTELYEMGKEIRDGYWNLVDEQRNSLTLVTPFETYTDIQISVNHYQADGSLCVDLWNQEEGPIARLTTCLNKKGIEENMSYLDENNCPWSLDFIEHYGLGRNTGKVGFSGYCMYPLIEWDLTELEKYA